MNNIISEGSGLDGMSPLPPGNSVYLWKSREYSMKVCSWERSKDLAENSEFFVFVYSNTCLIRTGKIKILLLGRPRVKPNRLHATFAYVDGII